jgi:hypothetical protein
MSLCEVHRREPAKPAWTYDRIGNRLTETHSGTTDTYTYQFVPPPGNDRSPLLASVALRGGGGNPRMYRIQRQAIMSVLPVLLLIIAFAFVYFGVPPLLPLRKNPDWPYVALVSVPPGTTPDTWSSVPGLLHLLLAAFQCVLLVEIARLVWSAGNALSAHRLLITITYEAALVFDMFRLWGRDWLVWILYQLNLGKLCSSTSPCYPISGAMPWLSLSALGLTLAVVNLDRVRVNPRQSSASKVPPSCIQ